MSSYVTISKTKLEYVQNLSKLGEICVQRVNYCGMCRKHLVQFLVLYRFMISIIYLKGLQQSVALSGYTYTVLAAPF